MTVPSEVNRNEYTGNAVADTFDYDFKIFDKSELLVSISDADGVDVSDDLVIDVDYVITGVGDDDGGQIEFTNPLPLDYTLILTPNLEITQNQKITNQGGFFPTVVENALDRLTLICKQLKEELNRKVGVSILSGASVDDYLGEVEAARDDAVAARVGAETAETNAEAAEDGAAAERVLAQAARLGAENAQAAAESAVAGSLWSDVVFVTSADSPLTLTAAARGKLYSVDTSSGAVTINLPLIATVGTPFNLGVKNTTADGNAVTINRNGTDTISGATSKVLATANQGTTLIADEDTSPDTWSTADFGAVGGNMTSDVFVAGVDYTKGVTTQLTLSVAPGSDANVQIFFDGVKQATDTYSVASAVVTFDAAISSDKVEAITGTSLSINVPADASVTTAKIDDQAVTPEKLSEAYQLLEPRVQSAASGDLTPTANDDICIRTAQAAALTINNPTGTMVQGQALIIRIKDNGTARAISYGSNYRAVGITLPTTTTISKTLYLAMIWNETDTKFDVTGVAQEA